MVVEGSLVVAGAEVGAAASEIAVVVAVASLAEVAVAASMIAAVVVEVLAVDVEIRGTVVASATSAATRPASKLDVDVDRIDSSYAGRSQPRVELLAQNVGA